MILRSLSNQYLRLLQRDQADFNACAHEFLDIYEKNQNILFIKDMYLAFLPLVKGMDEEYIGKQANIKERKEKVLTAANVFDELNETQVHKWAVAVEQFYLNDTPEFNSIFSKGEKVFNRGSRKVKIDELKAMIKTAKNYTDLGAVVDSMQNYCDLMESALSNRNKVDSSIKTSIDKTGDAARKVAEELYANQGRLMIEFKTNPEKILQYIPVKYFKHSIKKAKETDANPYVIEIAPKSVAEAGIPLPVNGKIVLYNSGDADLKVWFAPTMDAAVPAITKLLAIEDEITLNTSTDAQPTDRFLFIQNETEEEGEAEIIIA